ncbi:hypothetical protein R3W88_004669 [Solanum pinnatisectum]|uniref:F-box domain-containing protein n=1 Tax=Solanum pinnatisectum TaxID=50273 RepID=A0AAV9K9Y5_9SOLN|nr:hypothetical protein R3W88_004669 [Solanum pinnatisectum]
MDGSSHLPGDIVNSIFLKLPVKSLSRFKSCCKSWHCCIDDADFIKSHLHKSSVDISRQKFVMVYVIPSLRTGSYQFKIVSTEASTNADSNVVYLNIPELFINYFCLEVLSCSGLVFMTSYDPGYSMILLNPTVGKYKFIPNSLLSQKKKTNRCSDTSPIFGFAYDFVAEDYKVICVHYLMDVNFNVVEVYPVKTQCWRAIHNIFPDSFQFLYKGQVSLNGVIHRMLQNGSEYTIILFHLADEKFTLMPVPSTRGGKQPTLRALGDGVCVFTTVGEENLIWSLEKDRWNCINKFPSLLSLIEMPKWSLNSHLKPYKVGSFLFVKENGNILWRKHDDSFIEYDLRKNEYTEFKSTQVPDLGTYKTLHVESLDSLKTLWD